MSLLKDSYLDDETTASLRALLSKHAARVAGLAKGRDITRVALRAKEGRIAELVHRVSVLEGEREMDRVLGRGRGGGGG